MGNKYLARCYGPWKNLKLPLSFKCHVDTARMSYFEREEGVKYVYIDSEPPWSCTPLEEIKTNAHRYDLIMTTYNEDILEQVPGSIMHHVRHDPYIDPSYKPEFEDKKFYVSYLISTWSRQDYGFAIRQPACELLRNHSVPHKIWSSKRTPYPGIEILPNTYPPDVLDDYNKSIIFDAMFSIATENHIQRNHWQEKALGCFWTRTVPIYYGCPNISDFGFREDGILRFNTVEELEAILDKLSPELYESMQEAVEHNFKHATENYSISQHDCIAGAIEEYFKND